MMAMKKIRFANGDEMDAIGLGTWKSEPGDVYKAVREAIRVGYRHFDCAWFYGNETEIGNAFTDAISSGELPSRADLFITSKLWCAAHAPEDVEPAVRDSLRMLQLDYLDLYLIHWPVVLKKNVGFPDSGKEMIPLEEMPISKTWKALEACVDKGLIKHIGVSNFNIPKLKKLLETARIRPEMNQVESHPLLAQNDLLKFCTMNGIHFTAYSPLGSGDRPAHMKKTIDGERNLLFENEIVVSIAKKHNVHPANILIKWAEQRGTAVIPKSVTPQRIQDNFHSYKIFLDKEDMTAIASIDKGCRFLDGKFWEIPDSCYTAESIWNE